MTTELRGLGQPEQQSKTLIIKVAYASHNELTNSVNPGLSGKLYRSELDLTLLQLKIVSGGFPKFMLRKSI